MADDQKPRQDPYPPYEVTFDGDLVEKAHSPEGPHSFTLQPIPPDVDVKIVLTRNKDHDPDTPSLKVEIKRVPRQKSTRR